MGWRRPPALIESHVSACRIALVVMMSIGNQEFGIGRENTKTKSVFGIYVSNFWVFSWYFIGILSTTFLKVGLILVFFGRIKIGLVFGFCRCHFIGI